MKANIKNRLNELESVSTDWISQLKIIDYDHILADYSNEEWVEVHHQELITVMRNTITGEYRGIYEDRRTDEEILAMGGDLAYL